MLAGKMMAGAASAGVLPTFISSSANRIAGGTATTVTAPTEIQNGDLLVAVSYLATNGIVTPPSGFSQIYTDTTAANPNVAVNVKIAASESGNYTFNSDTAGNLTAAILVYRNANKVNTISSVNRGNTLTSVAPSITPTYNGVLLALFSNANNGVIVTPPSSMTQRVAQVSGSPNLAIYELSPQSATATGDKSLVWQQGTSVTGLQLQITNEPTVAPEFVASASTQNTVNGTTLVINKPTGTIENDLMVLVCAGAFSGANDYTFPAGWTQAADLGSANGLSVAYKTAGASEPSDYTVTATNSSRHAGSILTYRFAAYDTIGAFVTASNPLFIPAISPANSQSILIAAGARQTDGITLGTPIGMTARITDADAEQPSYKVCDQLVAKGPTGTRAMSTGSTNTVAGIMLSIKPTRSL